MYRIRPPRRAARCTAFLAAAVALAYVALFFAPVVAFAQTAAPLRFELRLVPEAAAQVQALGLEVPVHGRAYVILTRDGEREPRFQVDVTGVPFWGMDVEGVQPGDTIVIEEEGAADGGAGAASSAVFGYPLASFAEIPPGEYYVQGFLNVYTTFRRADGHTVRLHLNAGEGQHPWSAPGNVKSPVRQVRIDPSEGGVVSLDLSEVIPPIEPVPPGGTLQQGNPTDTRLVKFVKIRSELLSRFWGRDMYIGANVLLPRDWHENPDARYPVLYLQGHFPGRTAPFGFTETGEERGRSVGFRDFWLSDAAPRMIVVTIRDANPYYDTSYSVNSANVGPYGDAITRELIPYIEERFRGIGEEWARVLAGGSTGGWEVLAMQIFYPDLFGGAWAWCPDAVDFRYHQIVNIYEDANAYVLDHGWVRVERPSNRKLDGSIQYTMRQENHFEYAVGNCSRSAGQWAIWEAVYGPVGDDGYPRPIWDPVTGVIDHDVAAYWKEHYDLTEYLKRNWETVGPKLVGKIHVAMGDMDSYYLNNATYLLEEFLASTTDPHAEASFEYGRRKPHCWIGASPTRPGEDLSYAEFVGIVAEHIAKRAPAGVRLP